MKQLFRIRKNKKGVSLIYVIIASAALLILGSVVAVSAMRNIDLTGNNHMSRYAYDRDKSAIEYAKGVLEQEYEADSTGGSKLKNFVVTNVKDGHGPYNCRFGDADIDGTNCFAKCKIKKGSDNKYNITINAGYPSSETDKKKLLKMKYTTQCTLGGEGFPFFVSGCMYGSKHVVSNDISGNMSGDARSPALLSSTANATSKYAVVFNLPVRTTVNNEPTGFLQAPQIFFFGGYSESDTIDGGFRDAALYANSKNAAATIRSNFIYIYSDTIVADGSGNSLNISPISGTGYIFFANTNGCNINDGAGTALNHTPYKGLYSFGAGTDLFSPSCSLTAVDKSDRVDEVLKANNVKYLEDNHEHFACSETNASYTFPYPGKADWTDNGCIKGSSGGAELNVFMYLDKKSSSDDPTQAWEGGSSPSYTAEKISLMYVTHDDINNPVITIGTQVTFNLVNNDEPDVDSDAVSFCGQKQDGAGNDTDNLTLQQGDKNAKFILQSDSENDITLTIYHKLVVKRKADSGYTLSAGTYTVPSGTNLFTASISDFTLKSGGGSSGGTGGGTAGGFSGGEYSWTKH